MIRDGDPVKAQLLGEFALVECVGVDVGETLAIEQRSSEVWRTLGAVKTEFAKFGDVLPTGSIALGERVLASLSLLPICI